MSERYWPQDTARSVTRSASPIIDAVTPYSAGDAVGGIQTFSDFFDFIGQKAVVSNYVLFDSENQNTAYHLFVFNETFTAAADNAAFAIQDADKAKCVGVIYIPTAAAITLSTNRIYQGSQALSWLPQLIPSGTTRHLYYQLRCVGTPTFTTTSSLTLKLYGGAI